MLTCMLTVQILIIILSTKRLYASSDFAEYRPLNIIFMKYEHFVRFDHTFTYHVIIVIVVITKKINILL